MIPVIRSIFAIDWNFGDPEPAEALHFNVTVEISEDGKAGADNFDVQVCNAAWLEQQLADRGFFWIDSVLLVSRFDHDVIRNAIERAIRRELPFDDWQDFVARVAPRLRWEFAGMEWPLAGEQD